MLVWALMGHILNKIFKMEYEAHAYGIELQFENVFKKWNLKKKVHFANLFLNEIESSFNFDFQLKVAKNHFRNKHFLKKELCLDRHLKVS